MKISPLFLSLAITLSVMIFSLTGRSQLLLFENNHSDYVIIIGENANKTDRRAASELQLYFKEMTGATLPILKDSEQEKNKEICIGATNRIFAQDLRMLRKDGFRITVAGQKLFFTGRGKGVLYAVYDFLEDDLGCRYLAPGIKQIPKLSVIKIDPFRRIEEPAFEARSFYFPGEHDQAFCDWNKAHSRKDSRKDWGMWVHTFDELIPPETYFDSHPEYFSLVGDMRDKYGQLCLSNPAVLDTLIFNLVKKMRKSPKKDIWSVSQNDNYNACECENCAELNDEYGGPSGTMIWFVNQVADYFPEKTISTLAYQYSRATPDNIVPASNVNIMLCTIECNRSMPISEDPSSESFVEDLEGWTQLSRNILLWDYLVQFRNYISPFPNLEVIQPNLQYYADFQLPMMFQQGSGKAVSEFVELRTYMVVKLLWDPYQDAKAIRDDFLEHYYGPAAPFIGKYLDQIHKKLRKSGDQLSIYGYPAKGLDSYLSEKNISSYFTFFDNAEDAVSAQPVFLKRVKTARLPLDFAMLDISLTGPTKKYNYFEDHGDIWVVRPQMLELLDDFTAGCKLAGIKQLAEHGVSPADYSDRVKDHISQSYTYNLAFGKSVVSISEFSEKYNLKGAAALTDGLMGMLDYNYNWLGFQGNDLETVVDLEKERLISSVGARFLQQNRSWIFFPKRVEYLVSVDGKKFHSVGVVENYIYPERGGVMINDFTLEIKDGIPARYIKIKAESLKVCPEWHLGAGKPAWIFTDELIVK